MTMLCIDYGWEEVGWRRSRQPTSSQKPNLLIACHSERSEESNKLKKLIQTIFCRSVVKKTQILKVQHPCENILK